jgi:hypothetical protein
VAAIIVEGLSDEVIQLLEDRAKLRAIDAGTVVRELIHIGLSLGLAAGEARHTGIRMLEGAWFDQRRSDGLKGVGAFETADPELLLS